MIGLNTTLSHVVDLMQNGILKVQIASKFSARCQQNSLLSMYFSTLQFPPVDRIKLRNSGGDRQNVTCSARNCCLMGREFRCSPPPFTQISVSPNDAPPEVPRGTRYIHGTIRTRY